MKFIETKTSRDLTKPVSRNIHFEI